MAVSTLTSAGLTIPYMPMTVRALDCVPPILEDDFEKCDIPGGSFFWSANGFYSPGQCFQGYEAGCTQTGAQDNAWPIGEEEIAVMCIPTGYTCNENGNPKYATTKYAGTTLSAPAFEIRWKADDVDSGEVVPWPTGSLASSWSVPPTLGTLEDSGTPAPTAKPSRSSDPPVPPPTDSSEGSSSSPLTPGYIAAIAVSTCFGTIIAVLSIVYLALRRRRRASKLSASLDSNDQQPPPQPTYALSPIQPPVELHSETMGPGELEPAPVSPESNNFPVSPTSTLVGRDRLPVEVNTVPVEMPGDQVFPKDTGIDEVRERMSETTNVAGEGEVNENRHNEGVGKK